MAEIYFFGVINYTFQPLNILLLQYTFLVNFPSIYPVLSGKSADPTPPPLSGKFHYFFFKPSLSLLASSFYSFVYVYFLFEVKK